MAKSTPASQQTAEQERRAAEAAKEQRRSELRGQIGNLNLQITTYDNQISSLESKLTSQRAMKTLFDGKSVDLDTEKAAKSVYTQNVSQYVKLSKVCIWIYRSNERLYQRRYSTDISKLRYRDQSVHADGNR